MTEIQILTALGTGAFLLVHLGVIARVILRPHREPASRVAWIVVSMKDDWKTIFAFEK